MGDDGYRLEDQVGHLMRRAQQRHLAVFAGVIPELTTTQFAALARLAEQGRCRRTSSGGRRRWTRRRSRAWSGGWWRGGW